MYSSDGVEVGKVDAVIDNYREHILDGFVVETREVNSYSPTRPRWTGRPSAP